MTVQADDKRRMERFDLKLPAKFIFGSQDSKNRENSSDTYTMDISAGGGFFYTDQPYPVGTPVRVDLTLPLDELKKIKGKMVKINISGAVVRSDASGTAVSFQSNYSMSLT